MIFLLPMFGVAAGVVVTAVASAVNTPTTRSFVVNVLLGASGYVVGLFIGFSRATLLPRDTDLISSTAIWTAVLACVAHELVRWLWAALQRAQQADQ